jgi:hypothetical protein
MKALAAATSRPAAQQAAAQHATEQHPAAQQPANPSLPAAAAGPVSTDRKCQALLEQAQLGEINEETRRALEKCH